MKYLKNYLANNGTIYLIESVNKASIIEKAQSRTIGLLLLAVYSLVNKRGDFHLPRYALQLSSVGKRENHFQRISWVNGSCVPVRRSLLDDLEFYVLYFATRELQGFHSIQFKFSRLLFPRDLHNLQLLSFGFYFNQLIWAPIFPQGIFP